MHPHHLSVVFVLFVAGCMNDPGEDRVTENLAIQNGMTHLVINEILFDPLQDSKDNIPDQPDFIEIYNPGTTPVDLTGWSIAHRTNSSTGFGTRYLFAKTGSNILGPGQYGVVTPEKNGNPSTCRLAVYYDYILSLPDAKILLDTSHLTLPLNNDGDSILLLDKNNVVVDQVSYLPAWHNPAIGSTKRISLEKFNPLMLSDSPLSWGSSTDATYGGTPGKVNSVYVPPSRNEEMFRISPNPFSPDGDLNDDVLRISVCLPAGSYQLAVTVYNTLGGQVRSLAAGTPAGPVALIFWDGRDDAGKPLPAGTYRIAMNAAGFSGSRYSSTESVVLAR